MPNTIYSHAFLVGSFHGTVTPEMLDNTSWELECIKHYPQTEEKRYLADSGYSGLCRVYYKAHLDAMIKAESQKRPNFLEGVCHYICKIEKDKQPLSLSRLLIRRDKDGKEDVTVQHLDDYHVRVIALHIYFFPLDTVLFALEIDDSRSDYNALTMAHSWLVNWIWNGDSRFHDNTKKSLQGIMSPLIPYLKDETLSNLLDSGNKMKIFQFVQTESKEPDTRLLYELGTSSPVGCVGSNMRLSPSEEYFNNIISNNLVSAFNNWKALALVDSFTMLGTPDSFRPEDCIYMYFPLIYLRCIFEKTFCFRRNNAYREDKVKGSLSKEITLMEKYYFYENISYNFLPNLLYKGMSKGMSLKEEREELSKQIKEKEEKNRDIILAIVSGFAIFSIVFDLYSIIIAAMGIPAESVSWIAQLLVSIGILGSSLLGYIFYSHRRL